MRIAFVTPEYITEENYDGGLANYLSRVCLSLIKFGHEPMVFVSSNKSELIEDKGVHVFRVNTKGRLPVIMNKLTAGRFYKTLNWLWRSWILNKTVKKIHQKKPITIVQHASYTATGLFRTRKITSVVRISSYQPFIDEAYGFEKPSIDQKVAQKLERIAFKRAYAVFGPSRMISDYIAKLISKPVDLIESPVYLDECGFDEELYKDLLLGKQYLLFYGSIGLLKGIATIATILNELLSKHPNLYFVFIGKDIGYLGKPMMDYVWEKAGSKRGRVLYLGKMRHEQLYPIIKNAFAVVLPSRVDNFPNTCLEAMAFGKTVIGTKGTSFEELITDSKNGFLCEQDNAGSLLNTLERVLNLDHAAMRRIGKNALERISVLKPEVTLPLLLKFYAKILKDDCCDTGCGECVK